jgi:hypothetical protein
MDASAADVFQTVEYRRGKWMMNRVPFALLFIGAGLFLALFVDPKPAAGPRILFAFVALMVITGALVASYMLLDYLYEGRNFILRVLAGVGAFFLGVFLLLAGVVRVGGVWRGPDLGAYNMGWLMIIAGAGWTAAAVFRHVRPPRPVLALSPVGLAYHGPLIKNLLIPWIEVEGVGGTEQIGINGLPFRADDLPAVLVSKAFYEQHIAPQRSVMRGPRASWDAMFIEKGNSMQIVLHPLFFSVKPKDIRAPVEARWKAFRNGLPAAAQPGVMPVRELGKWSLTPWQAIAWGLPLLAIAAILLKSMGVGRG